GWIPTLFSPEHVAEFRPLLQEGADRVEGKTLHRFAIAPTVSVFVPDARQAARDAMRPFIALYVGGMGSRQQNFYNQLVQRYGFEDAARTVQDLYLDGKREEAMAARARQLVDTGVPRARGGGAARRHAAGLREGRPPRAAAARGGAGRRVATVPAPCGSSSA